ncbi:MAG: nucleoside-diphosphate sugar epimerase/dehydratase [Ilumatobacter sp.]|uniref:nucleoside-diphosphate sugar epimerase/dehydratase n=1 Tax=Ilumatobacter sp. TaxID=1967498 RepID=UPI00260DB229|nr:nucleoside-diphosphate sugar epimerase/dehydratase [Ilumatobacter sp.]MDJ0768627.1 nucleoside-diphosphate sugar epimerase/dehydratase [Ilumatobacter sp.]
MNATFVQRSLDVLRRRLPVIHYLVDCMVWLVALPLTTFSRYDFTLGELELDATTRSWAVAVVGQGIFGVATGLYTRRWRYGSFDEVAALAATVVLTGFAMSIVHVAWFMDGAPRSVPALTAAVAIAGTVAVRSIWRLYRQKKTRNELQDAEPLVIVGAGEGGEQIIRALLSDPSSQYQPVALLDDDANRRRLSISGVRVQGPVSQMREIAARYGARDVLLAVPSATSELVRDVDTIASNAGLRLLVVPAVDEMFGELGVGDIRPVSEADLLGRRPADIDADAVAQYVTGRRVLVTGAGGSIGSELCRQLARFEPAALLKLDRDESGLHAVQLSIHGRALLDGDDLVLADIRDRDRIFEVFDELRPDVVFHAAALKHLPLLESAPKEGWKTNVAGTQNLLDAAERIGVDHFVNVSTDKAANPTSVLGYTKLLTERLTAHKGLTASGTYVSVRFGNVLGSRGSVLPAFREQAKQGGPITVTHPDITRYFMLVEEASLLVINAGAIGRDGEVLVLDMGEPVRIADVARRFAEQQHPPLDIVFTGLRPGEKLHEDLVALDEDGGRPFHPLITHVQAVPTAFDSIIDLGALEPTALVEALRDNTVPSAAR